MTRNGHPVTQQALPARTGTVALFMAGGAVVLLALAPIRGFASQDFDDDRVHEALAQGYWVVQSGEGLMAITRRFFPDETGRQRALRLEMFKGNPKAFVNGDANQLMAGARLRLPSKLAIVEPANGASRAPAARPEAMVTKSGAGLAGQSAAPNSGEMTPLARTDDPPPIPERASGLHPTSPAAYVDKLIDESAQARDDRLEEEARDHDPPLGRRAISIDLRSEHRESGTRRLREGGLGLRYRRETADWGEFALEADLRDATTRDTGGKTRDHGGWLTLYQYRTPFASQWLADSSLGLVRSLPPNMVSTGFRLNLPTTLLWGGGTSFYTDASRIYAQAGRAAHLVGLATQQVEIDDARVAVVGGEHQALPWLRLGAQANAFRVRDGDPTQGSVALAGEIFSPGTRARAKLVAIGDDERRKGFWFEGDAFQDFFHHRFGAYQFDRDLVYSLVPTINDERLAYVRTDYRSRRLTYSLSLDVRQTNLDRDPSRSGEDSLAAFGSFNLRLSRMLSLGGSVNVRHEEPRTPVASKRDLDSETASLRISNRLGTTSFDLARTSERTYARPNEREVSIAWNQDWPGAWGINASTTLSRSKQTGALGDLKRTVAGITLRSFPLTGVYFDLNVVGVRVDRAAGTEDNVNASIGANWQFHSDWQAQLYATYNTIETSLADQGNPGFRDRSVQLTLRYQRAQGVPIVALGARTPGAGGTGRISGRVFFDENDDGFRQPGERPAARVRLLLDGRFPVTTDAEGRFEYPLVNVGRHAVQVAAETVPLPWGLPDERSIAIVVPLRGDAMVEVALRRIAPN